MYAETRKKYATFFYANTINLSDSRNIYLSSNYLSNIYLSIYHLYVYLSIFRFTKDRS